MMIYTVQQMTVAPLLSPSFIRSYGFAKVIIGISVVVAFGYITYRFGLMCFSDEDRIWRSYIFMVFSSVFIFAVFLIITSNALMPLNYSGSSIVLVYGLVNVYVYYLQIMYTITEEEVGKLQGEGGLGGMEYDMITTGTIDVVEVNLEEGNENEKYVADVRQELV
jgi:hypothetical protein